MFTILKHLKKKLVIYLPITMLLAIIYGYYFNAAPLKEFVTPIIFLMVYPMMVNLKYKELITGGNSKLHIMTQVVNFIVIPVLAFIIGSLFFGNNEYLITGILIMALLPTSGMTISWTGFAKGNISAAIKMMIVGLVLGSLLTPVYLKLFMGESINIPFTDILLQIVKIVFIPMLAGFITQWLLINKFGREVFQKKYKPKFPLLATIGLFGIVFISTALKAKTIVGDPILLVKILVALIIFYSINFTITTLIAKRFFNREDAIALVYGTVMRNLSIALAIAISLFTEKGSEVALILAVAFVVQIQGAALYLKVVNRIFGRPNKINS